VREGAAEAYVEGVFSLPAELLGDERLPEDCEELVLARRVWPDGRTRAYVCGRTATVGDLRELGSRLLSFYGQHESRKLMLAAAQLDVLDGFCGPQQWSRRAAFEAAHECVRRLETRFAELAGLDGARERELDLLAYELREIEAVEPSEEEERELLAERDRLRHQEALRTAAARAAGALLPEESEGAVAQMARAAGELATVSRFDPTLTPLAERLEALRYESEDVARELCSYTEGIEATPGRLEQVEERLDAYARLVRKHGGSVHDVLAHAARCRAREGELRGAEVALEEVSAELAEARSERERLGAELTAARHRAAPRLGAQVLERLADLAMADASFEVVVRPREDGFTARGGDEVELVIAPNAGLRAGPLREIASGGELSRVMLALLSIAHGGGSEQTAGAGPEPRVAEQLAKQSEGLLVFDEIDAGVGGRTARAVGEHLRALARGRQVLCITHLPQVAALADRHFTIVKDGSVSPARTTVVALEGDAVVGELVRMLGAAEGDRAARGHARELLRAA
jgi:DNA repair protein RecN (Recombination protein N)